jgi:hypothetical protein
MGSTGRLVGGFILSLVCFAPFAVEGIICALLGLFFGLLYFCSSCLWCSRAVSVRAKGCWLLREAALYLAASITSVTCVGLMSSLRSVESGIWRLATIPTFFGMVDINRFAFARVFSLVGASGFNGGLILIVTLTGLDAYRDSIAPLTCCMAPGDDKGAKAQELA